MRKASMETAPKETSLDTKTAALTTMKIKFTTEIGAEAETETKLKVGAGAGAGAGVKIS